jgi:hypothetical protein
MSRTFSTIGRDEHIDGFAMTKSVSEEPSVTIPRQSFQSIEAIPTDGRNEREIIQHAELQIMRAILDKSTRKWEFVWAGVTLSAPVLDDSFYREFFDHRITVAPGDVLECDLKMYQRKTSAAGIFTNYKYEVINVVRHIPRIETEKLFKEQK